MKLRKKPQWLDKAGLHLELVQVARAQRLGAWEKPAQLLPKPTSAPPENAGSRALQASHNHRVSEIKSADLN